MSTYNLVEKQKPFQPALNTSKITFTARYKKNNFEITELIIGPGKGKKFPVKKGDILSAFKEGLKHCQNSLKKTK